MLLRRMGSEFYWVVKKGIEEGTITVPEGYLLRQAAGLLGETLPEKYWGLDPEGQVLLIFEEDKFYPAQGLLAKADLVVFGPPDTS